MTSLTAAKPPINLDAMMTVEQFAEWLQVDPAWVRKRLRILPGVVCYSRKTVRINPRAHLEGKLKKKI